MDSEEDLRALMRTLEDSSTPIIFQEFLAATKGLYCCSFFCCVFLLVFRFFLLLSVFVCVCNCVIV